MSINFMEGGVHLVWDPLLPKSKPKKCSSAIIKTINAVTGSKTTDFNQGNWAAKTTGYLGSIKKAFSKSAANLKRFHDIVNGAKTFVNSDCHGLAKPTGSQVGSARVRVRIGYFQPSPYPDHHHGLAVTHEKTRSDTIKFNINITKNFSLLIY